MWAKIGLVLLAAFAAAATVDLLRELTSAQVFFNRWSVRRWLRRGMGLRRAPFYRELLLIVQDTGAHVDLETTDQQHTRMEQEQDARIKEERDPADESEVLQVEAQLLALVNAGDPWTVYRVTLSQFAALANTVTDRILDWPRRHDQLLRALAGPPPSRNFAGPRGRSHAPQESSKRAGSEEPFLDLIWHADIAQLLSINVGFREAVRPRDSDREDSEAASLLEVRARVAQLIQRRLDELQTQGRFGWRVFVLVIATLSAFAVCLLMGSETAVPNLAYRTWLASTWHWLIGQVDAARLAVVAGILSAAAHDALVLLRRRSER
ncbi:MAG: hypothetical protein OEW19_04410 [Acidobacteriota bacterium]|nr:hypothetical protein [Acidobacteriota bacterium]